LLADLAASERRRGALMAAGDGAVVDWCARDARWVPQPALH
jgi:hypothetical protein